MPRIAWLEEEKQTAFRLLDDGMTAREVGEQLGRSKNSVISLDNRERPDNSRIDNRRFWTEAEHQLAVDMWLKDATIFMIADKLGKTKSNVSGRMTNFRHDFPKKGQEGTRKHVATFYLEKPTPENTIIQYEFREIPVPEDAVLVPFVDLQPRQCKWICNTFWEESDSQSLCCGLTVLNYKGSAMQRNYCEKHYSASIKKDVE